MIEQTVVLALNYSQSEQVINALSMNLQRSRRGLETKIPKLSIEIDGSNYFIGETLLTRTESTHDSCFITFKICQKAKEIQ